jgi:hypothetical protein
VLVCLPSRNLFHPRWSSRYIKRCLLESLLVSIGQTFFFFFGRLSELGSSCSLFDFVDDLGPLAKSGSITLKQRLDKGMGKNFTIFVGQQWYRTSRGLLRVPRQQNLDVFCSFQDMGFKNRLLHRIILAGICPPLRKAKPGLVKLSSMLPRRNYHWITWRVYCDKYCFVNRMDVQC